MMAVLPPLAIVLVPVPVPVTVTVLVLVAAAPLFNSINSHNNCIRGTNQAPVKLMRPILNVSHPFGSASAV